MTIDGSPDAASITGTGRPPTVRDVMRAPTTTVELRAHLAAAAYLMKRSGDSALVVTRDGATRTPLGIVTDADISQAVADGRNLEEVRISDLMPGCAVEVASGTSVEDATRLMLDRRVHHLLVVADGALAGIVDMADLCRVLVGPRRPWGATAARD